MSKTNKRKKKIAGQWVPLATNREASILLLTEISQDKEGPPLCS